MPHFPTSSHKTGDDLILKNVSNFLNTPLTILEKMDGSNVCLERQNCFARTHSSLPKSPEFNAFKALHTKVKHNIPENLQIFGEWLWLKHSIYYNRLPAYFLMFGVRDLNTSAWYSWGETEKLAKELDLHCVPVVYQAYIRSESDFYWFLNNHVSSKSRHGEKCEGVVIRKSIQFDTEDFSSSIGKYVLPNFFNQVGNGKTKNKLAIL
jgi:RNA ligase